MANRAHLARFADMTIGDLLTSVIDCMAAKLRSGEECGSCCIWSCVILALAGQPEPEPPQPEPPPSPPTQRGR